MGGRGEIQKVAFVLVERAGSSERYSGSVMMGDIVTESSEKEPHSGGGLTALTECAAPLGDGQQKCGPH